MYSGMRVSFFSSFFFIYGKEVSSMGSGVFLLLFLQTHFANDLWNAVRVSGLWYIIPQRLLAGVF